MNRQLMREYRAFRGTGCLVGHDARVALENARTVLLWERLESAGLVRLEVLPDEHFDWSGLSDEERERHGNDGAWGVVGQFRTSEDEEWEGGDSVWGHVGYRDVSDPHENCYVPDIMAETIKALRGTLKARCPLCRQPVTHTH